MSEQRKFSAAHKAARFNREFFDSSEDFTYIGSGEFGGKASGLAFARDILANGVKAEEFGEMVINIPRLTVLTTSVFDAFMSRNKLHDIAYSNHPDDRIAHAFQKASFPTEFVGDLMGLIHSVHQPLAVRSSSLLEDALYHPFAGVYATKMIPNNQLDVETRFKRLIEAVKFVWASTYFKEAKAYIQSTEQSIESEKMAVVIQEVAGQRFGDRFYPNVSGVARSYNFYPQGRARPDQGVVDLALGLGKTIVDGGVCWTYSPAFPRAVPPFASARDMVRQTQSEFWAVNMGKPPAYDPINETEYMVKANLQDADADDALRFVASTYSAESDRLSAGTGSEGPRVLTFAPILDLGEIPLNALIRRLLTLCQDAVGAPVEMEFAMTLDSRKRAAPRFGFLQVRPMMVSDEQVDIAEDSLEGENVLAASETVLGNGTVSDIRDVVYVRPELFEARNTRVIAEQIAQMNRRLVEEKRPYLLVGFGRWGSSDPWLGIPVNWSEISAAKAIVEATLPEMNVDLSQGSHFFHNLSSFQVSYFAVRHDGRFRVDWSWLERQQAVSETMYVKHVRLARPLTIRVDGRSGRGVIIHD